MKPLPLALLATTLIACAIEEDDFPATYAEEWCDRMEECEEDTYEDLWDTEEDCEDDAADVVELWLDLGDLGGGVYDGTKGRECVTNLRKLSCDDFEDGDHDCDVWEDDE